MELRSILGGAVRTAKKTEGLSQRKPLGYVKYIYLIVYPDNLGFVQSFLFFIFLTIRQ